MALIERLMGLEGDENKISVHDFFSAQQEVVYGTLTAATVKNHLNMDTATQAEYDALIAKYPTGTTAVAYFNKSTFIQRIHAVFILAEKRYPGYSTPAEVRGKLGI